MSNKKNKKFNTAKELENRVNAYFKSVEDSKETFINSKTGMPTIRRTPAYYGRLLLYCDMIYSTARPYEMGEYDTDNEDYSSILTRARQFCECDMLEGAAKGIYTEKTVNSALQRHHMFAEKREVDITGTVDNKVDLTGYSVQQLKDMLKD